MTSPLRRLMPVLAPFALGALAYFALGDGPHTQDARTGGADDWSLPAETPRDLAAAAQVWSKRSPWGVATAAGEGAAEAVGGTPVGVIAAGDRLQALFAFPDGRVTRVGAMDALPDGGQVTQVTPEVVAWTDAAGRAQRRELLVDPAIAGATEPASAATTARRGPAAERGGPRNGQRPVRPPVRPSGQRSARPAVQPSDRSNRSSQPAPRPNRSGNGPGASRPSRPASSRPASRD